MEARLLARGRERRHRGLRLRRAAREAAAPFADPGLERSLRRVARRRTSLVVAALAVARRGGDLYHFRENPNIEGFFDYRLRPGPVTERNAIRVLARMGFPDEIVADALAFADGGANQDQ